MRGFIGAVFLVGMLTGCGGTELDAPEDSVFTEATELKAAEPVPENLGSRDCSDLIIEDCAIEGAVVNCNAGGYGFRCTCVQSSWVCAR